LVGSDESQLTASTGVGTWLHVAARKGQLGIVKGLVKMGADVNAHGGITGGTPLNSAAIGGHFDTVSYLLSIGADVDEDEPEHNPLFSAIQRGHTDVAKLLIESGINIEVTYMDDLGGRNALSLAKECGQTEIAEILIAAGVVLPDGTPEIRSDDDHPRIITLLTKEFGAVDEAALQEVVPVHDGVHVAINVIRPNERHHCLTLFTTGMSDQAMTLPKGEAHFEYAELLMHLPADWPMKNPDDGWPLQWLRQIAYYPHQAKTWLGGRYSIIANDEPPEPLGTNTELSCLLLIADFADWSPIDLGNKRVHVYTVMPLYKEERDFEVKNGLRPLMERFEQNGISTVVDINRKNVALIS